MARNVAWDATAVNANSNEALPYVWERGAPDIQEYKTAMSNALEQSFRIGARSTWMYGRADIQFDGIRTAKVPIIESAGLGDYRRNQGYALSASNLSYESFEVRMDRSTHLSIDRLDLDEVGGLMTLGNMAREQLEEYIIPEIDAYNYSAIAAKVGEDFPENIKTTDITRAGFLDELRLIRAGLENEFSTGNLAYFMTPINAAYLTAGLEKIITYQDFAAGSISTKVKAIDGVPIIEVPGLRFHTAYEFGAGTTNPDEVALDNLGFKVAEISEGVTAPEMLYMVAPLDCAQAFTKFNVTKIETPETSDIDSWELKKRIVYDCWITKKNAERVKIGTGKLTA